MEFPVKFCYAYMVLFLFILSGKHMSILYSAENVKSWWTNNNISSKKNHRKYWIFYILPDFDFIKCPKLPRMHSLQFFPYANHHFAGVICGARVNCTLYDHVICEIVNKHHEIWIQLVRCTLYLSWFSQNWRWNAVSMTNKHRRHCTRIWIRHIRITNELLLLL